MYDKSKFVFQFKRLLDVRGLSQKAVAERLGTTEASISRYAAGVRTPRIETAVELAAVLNVSLNELCGIETPAAKRQSPDSSIMNDVYPKLTDGDRKVLWALLDKYMTPDQRIIVTAVFGEEKSEVV